jgi:hypothetical protein
MIASTAQQIFIYTEKGTHIPWNHPKIEVVHHFLDRVNYATSAARKTDATIDLLGRGCDRIFQADADILVTGDIGSVFDREFDVAVTSFAQQGRELDRDVPLIRQHAGWPGGAFWLVNTALTREFMLLWKNVQDAMVQGSDQCTQIKSTGEGLAHDCVALTKILEHAMFDPTLRILSLNYLIYNSFPLMTTYQFRLYWFSCIRRLCFNGTPPLVLHFPQNQWRDEAYVCEAMSLLGVH